MAVGLVGRLFIQRRTAICKIADLVVGAFISDDVHSLDFSFGG